MKSAQEMKSKIHKDISELSRIIGLLSAKYNNEPLLNDVQKIFLRLSVNVGRELNINLQ